MMTTGDLINSILEILALSDKPVSKSDLARMTGVCKATVSKYVDILEAKGLVNIIRGRNTHYICLKEKT